VLTVTNITAQVVCLVERYDRPASRVETECATLRITHAAAVPRKAHRHPVSSNGDLLNERVCLRHCQHLHGSHVNTLKKLL